MKTKTLSPELLHKMDAYWRAANYLSVGQIYLYDNPLLKRPLTLADVKHMLLGHWGTTPGQNFIYVHLNRVIKKYDLDMIYVSGPGHGGPAVVGNTYLEGTYSEIYPNISQDEAGLRKLFHSVFVSRRNSQPRLAGDARARFTKAASWAIRSAIRSGRCSTIPISSSPASSAMARRKPDRWPRPGIPTSFSIRPPTARCCRSCISTATRSPTRPSSPASTHEELEQLLRGYGWTPYFVEGHEPDADARGHGRDARHGGGADQKNPAGRPRPRQPDASALADDRPQFTQGLDGAEGGRWPAD